MVNNRTDLRRLAASAAGSVRAEGLNPSANAQELVEAMLDGTKSAAEALRELVDAHQSKTLN
jgi:uncharacterized protein (DUF2252 family)